MLTETQIKTIWAITNIFETSKPHGDYTEVAVLSDGAGISYGRSQATDKGGTLDRIILQYVHRKGRYAGMLAPYIVRLNDNPPTLQNDKAFIELLKFIGKDPTMQKVQDDVFADGYWKPAFELGNRLELNYALSYAILYDIAIQSGIGRVGKLRQTFDAVPPSKGGDEKEWTLALNKARRIWLAKYPLAVVQATVYRPDTYGKIAKSDWGWDLSLPLNVRGVAITANDL